MGISPYIILSAHLSFGKFLMYNLLRESPPVLMENRHNYLDTFIELLELEYLHKRSRCIAGIINSVSVNYLNIASCLTSYIPS